MFKRKIILPCDDFKTRDSIVNQIYDLGGKIQDERMNFKTKEITLHVSHTMNENLFDERVRNSFRDATIISGTRGK